MYLAIAINIGTRAMSELPRSLSHSLVRSLVRSFVRRALLVALEILVAHAGLMVHEGRPLAEVIPELVADLVLVLLVGLLAPLDRVGHGPRLCANRTR